MQQTDVTIAIVVPWIHGVRGHRTSIKLARELAVRGARVDFFVARIYERLAEQVANDLGVATLHVGRTISTGTTSMLKFARYQYSRSLDRELARAIAARHTTTPFDLIFVISNEGHWLAGYLRTYLPSPRPFLAVCVRELVEHPFWLGYERSWSSVRTMFSPLYPLAHEVETQRLRQFDLIFSNSPWTSILLDYFYGIQRCPALVLVDESFFDVPIPPSESSYIAVPTASLDRQGIRLIQRIHGLLPNLRTFGGTPVPGLPHEGFLSDADLVSFLARASATLFVFDYEALGLIPLESLAVGTPVATLPKQGPYSVLAGNPHVRFGETAEELSSASEELARLVSDPGWRLGCRRSVSQFHPEQAVERWLTDLCVRTSLGGKLAPLRSRPHIS